MPDPKLVVARGYDRNRYQHLVDAMDGSVRRKYLDALFRRVPTGSRILELGCGSGRPMTAALVQRYNVVGVDLSAGQLERARGNVPAAGLVRGDMTRLPFVAGRFDAVAAFYSITHVPRGEHNALLGDASRVLRLGGWLVATMGHGDTADFFEDDWLGAPMFFSHYPGAANDPLVTQAGFHIDHVADENELEYDDQVTFRWYVAQKSVPEP